MGMRNSLAIICRHCEQENKPILFVAYTSIDKTYQFLCDGNDHVVEDGLTIHISHVVKDDISIKSLIDIKRNFVAERENTSTPWKVDYSNIDDDDLDLS
jgi:hypothetical protein